MILVVASTADTSATEFVREFAGVADVAAVTCRDLAENRVVLRYPDFGASTLQIGGRTICIDDIEGAINALPAVFPEELVFFPPEEQEYQAAEFHALLTFLLRAVRAPVINRPAPGNLAGPFAGPLAWYHLAQACGIPTSPVDVDTHDFANPLAPHANGVFEVGSLDGSLIVASGTAADHYTPALCRHAKVEYLRAAYRTNERDEPELLMVRTAPDLASDAMRRALIDFFARRAGRT
jgi:hypothetical protein